MISAFVLGVCVGILVGCAIWFIAKKSVGTLRIYRSTDPDMDSAVRMLLEIDYGNSVEELCGQKTIRLRVGQGRYIPQAQD